MSNRRSKAVGTPRGLIRLAPPPVPAERAPTTRDVGFPIGQHWINKNSGEYVLLGYQNGQANWEATGGGTTAVDSLGGDSGTALPVGGKINIVGTANQIQTVGSGDDITISLTDSVIIPNSLTLGNGSLTIQSTGNPSVLLQAAASGAQLTGIAGNTNIVITPTGTGATNITAGDVNVSAGDLMVSREEIGGNVIMTTVNTDNTNAASNAYHIMTSGGAAGGDAATQYTNGVSTWTVGLDNSDADGYVIAASGTLGTTNVAFWNAAGDLVNTGSIRVNSSDLSLTNGDVFLETAGNKLGIATGVNASIGSATLVGGTVTVNTTAVEADSLIFISRASIGATGAAALGDLTIGTVTAGASFVINAVQAADATALQASDVSVVNWWIIN